MIYTRNKPALAPRLGFTLVELSISLLIISILLLITVTTINGVMDQRKIEITNMRLDEIEQAIAIYIALNGRLPCPASLAQIQDNNTFGVETLNTSYSPAICNVKAGMRLSTVSGYSTYYGAVPVRTLGLPNEYMFDGWGNRIAYAVQRHSVNNKLTNTSCISDGNNAQSSTDNQYICFLGQASGSNSSSGSIIVNDLNGNVITKDAVYIIYSAGPNGYGAYFADSDINIDAGSVDGPNINANLAPPSGNIYECYNANCNSNNVTYAQGYITKTFDDIVRFKTRNNLVVACNLYGGNACAKLGIYLK